MELGRWVNEVKEVWKVSFVDLGLVILACAIGFAVPGMLVQRVGSPLAIAAFWAVALPVMAWLTGAVHLQCFRNAETGKSTSFGDASQEAFERWDDVVLGVVFYGLMLSVAGALVLPGVVAGGVLLPYVVIVMVEKQGPIDALRRNIELAQGRWVALVVYWLMYYAALVVGLSALGVATVVATTLGLFAGPAVGGMMALVAVVAGVGAFFLAPLPVVAAVATYRMIADNTDAVASEPAGGAVASAGRASASTAPQAVPSQAALGAGMERMAAAAPVAVEGADEDFVESAPRSSGVVEDGIEVDLEGFDDDGVFEVERSGLAGDSVFDDEDEATSEAAPGFKKASRADEGPYW
ncbi:hypothetical protein FRC98_17890 [Lujinxingia vulgaris]|uniref:Glycerophosphoryl diester phosphodiesterase membrane domain-containing protein n=1 Tax=Lujinxingia vulgaris TaxID=2600176 RepID=A0A5C6WZT3_9DELT|nr:hypothetical protein [Lujinxingia vulgaris]TXD34990.1 hypothetical protein FRC98_17890 [Lujinxingia vulgaris]